MGNHRSVEIEKRRRNVSKENSRAILGFVFAAARLKILEGLDEKPYSAFRQCIHRDSVAGQLIVKLTAYNRCKQTR